MRDKTVRTVSLLIALLSAITASIEGQEQAAERELHRTKQSLVRNFAQGMVSGNSACDGEQSVYLQRYDEQLRSASPIRKVTSKGELSTIYDVTKAGPDLQGIYGYNVNESGELLLVTHNGKQYEILKFARDGSFKKRLPIESGFFPLHVAEFENETLLIAGFEKKPTEENRRAVGAYTGIFDPSGKLLKRISFEEDGTIEMAGANGDSRLTGAQGTSSNRALLFTQIFRGSDGNMYLARWSVPTYLYAISSAGEVVKRVSVEPKQNGMWPLTFQASGRKIAIQYENRNEHLSEIDAVDMASGSVVVRYSMPLRAAFTCYASDPDRFWFLGSQDGSVSLELFEP